MNIKPLHRIASSLLLMCLLAACGKSPASTPTKTTLSTAIPAAATAVPIIIPPTPTAAAPTAVPPTAIPPTAAPLSAAGGGCTNAYYPAAIGASWTYTSSGGSLGKYTLTKTITASSDTEFSANSQYSTGVNYVIKWNCQDGNLSALDAGAESFSMTTSKIKFTSNSITVEGYFVPAAFDPGKTWSEKVNVEGTAETSPSKSVNAQIFNQFDCTSAGAETITVPDGKFDTVKATCNKTVVVSSVTNGKATPLGTNHEVVTYWYAKGIGLIKSAATGGSNNETVVLTQHKIQ